MELRIIEGGLVGLWIMEGGLVGLWIIEGRLERFNCSLMTAVAVVYSDICTHYHNEDPHCSSSVCLSVCVNSARMKWSITKPSSLCSLIATDSQGRSCKE